MKKLSELMVELGFDPEGSSAVKEAFIKYLIKASEGMSVLPPTENAIIKANPTQIKVLRVAQKSEQLSFGFITELTPKSKFLRKTQK
ncbi:MAG TPA: hypothetical protein VIG33_13015 [Pseudobdellovibrionaceae bacterium]|jgi:hypothetical protein